jgi:methionine-gamma-lyase
LAVSLGFYKTLFSCSGSSTSSEIPEEERKEMGLSDGLIRFSIGLTTILKELTKNERMYGKLEQYNLRA